MPLMVSSASEKCRFLNKRSSNMTPLCLVKTSKTFREIMANVNAVRLIVMIRACRISHCLCLIVVVNCSSKSRQLSHDCKL